MTQTKQMSANAGQALTDGPTGQEAISMTSTDASIAQGGAGDKLAKAALLYAQSGWHVFPLKTNDKTPLTAHGVKDATADPDTVRNWWAQWPTANLGLHCGASGLLILDFDTDKEGYAGGELLERLRSEHPTTTQRTGGGGYHLLYQQPDGDTLGNGRGALPKGVDVRGQGGYIVVAPSIHPNGNPYQWLPGLPKPQPLPAFILDILRPKAAQLLPTNGNGPHSADDDYQTAERCLERLRPGRADDYQEWVNVGMALSGLGADGLQLWDWWSSQSAKYTPGACEKKWQTFKPGTGLSLGSLVHWANEDDPPTTQRHTHGAHMEEPPGWIGADEWTPDEPPHAPQTAQGGQGATIARSEAEKERFTDLGNARRFTRLHGASFRYTQQWGWLAWTGQRWEMDGTGAVMRAAKATATAFYTDAAALLDAAKRRNEAAAADGLSDTQRAKLAGEANDMAAVAREMNTWAKTCQGRARLESMVKLAESELPIATKTDDFNLKPWALNVQNGTVDLRTGKLQPHERGDLLTALAPVDYEPGALCPTWDKFLHRIMDGDTEMVDFLRRAIGYSLTGDVSEQKLFFPHGGGSNGKSTFITTLLSLLGQDYAAQAAPELLVVGKDRHPTEVADLYGKRLVASIEVEDGRRLAEGLVKQLTGGDKIKARLMRQDFFQFDPTHKMWLVANHKPVVKGTDYAIWRRILLIPFDVTITDEEKDPQLPAKLLAEGPGILAWAVRGCLEWQRQGLGVPESVKRATETYRADSDTFGAFLAECTVTVKGHETKASELYKAYETWCADNGERPIGGKQFGLKLTENEIAKVKTRQGIFYQGLGIVDHVAE